MLSVPLFDISDPSDSPGRGTFTEIQRKELRELIREVLQECNETNAERQ